MSAFPIVLGATTTACGLAAITASVRGLIPAPATTGRHRAAQDLAETVPGPCPCVGMDRLTTHTLHPDGTRTCRSCGKTGGSR